LAKPAISSNSGNSGTSTPICWKGDDEVQLLDHDDGVTMTASPDQCRGMALGFDGQWIGLCLAWNGCGG
jgi:hypothetical protein